MTGMFMEVAAPFSKGQVLSLRAFQECEKMVPYICPECELKLVPVEAGLVCSEHGLMRRWALKFALEFPTRFAELKKDDL